MTNKFLRTVTSTDQNSTILTKFNFHEFNLFRILRTFPEISDILHIANLS